MEENDQEIEGKYDLHNWLLRDKIIRTECERKLKITRENIRFLMTLLGLCISCGLTFLIVVQYLTLWPLLFLVWPSYALICFLTDSKLKHNEALALRTLKTQWDTDRRAPLRERVTLLFSAIEMYEGHQKWRAFLHENMDKGILEYDYAGIAAYDEFLAKAAAVIQEHTDKAVDIIEREYMVQSFDVKRQQLDPQKKGIALAAALQSLDDNLSSAAPPEIAAQKLIYDPLEALHREEALEEVVQSLAHRPQTLAADA